MIDPHQVYKAGDGSECIRKLIGDPWTMVKGDRNSEAYKFMKAQNRFWPQWIKDAVERYIPGK